MPFVFGDITDYLDGDKLEYRGYKWIARGHFAEGDLSPGNADAFCFNWQNPHPNPIIVTRVILDITTPGGTAGGEIDVGSAASSGVHSDNLIDGCDPNVATVYDNIDNKGTNGNSKVRLDANGGDTDWITGQILLQNQPNLAGKYYIEYIEVL